MITEFLVLGVLPVLFLAAAGWDLASYTIPNFLPASLIAAFFVFVLCSGMGVGSVGLHLAAGMIGLATGFAFFSLGYVGGGDAKLFAAAALWFGLRDLADYTLFASIFGGLLTLGLLTFRKMPWRNAFRGQEWLLRLHDQQAGIPYGTALAAGAFAILPYTDVFRLGVTG